MKTMKTISITIMALLLSAQLMAQQGAPRRATPATEAKQQAEGNTQQLVVPLSDPGKPYKLNVDLTFGSIRVTGYDGKDIIIDASSPDKKHGDRESNGMRRLSGGENMDVTAREKNNTVTIGSAFMPGRGIMLSIKVPQGATNVKLTTVNDGDIVASNLNGQLEIQNTNGSIELKDVSGSVVANTTNGKVVVVLKSIDPKAPMAFTSLNGNVDVTLPAGTKANVKARAERDNVYSDFEFASEPSSAKTSKTAKDGMYRLTVEDWITGKIGGGGPEMLFKTFNGNIYIRKVK
jgi:DUF4097 and DUF4098 domain-containing protein YvlB